MNEKKIETMKTEMISLIKAIKNQIDMLKEVSEVEKAEFLSEIKKKYNKLDQKLSDLQNFLLYNKISEDDSIGDLEEEIYDLNENITEIENKLYNNNEPTGGNLNGANQEIMNQANDLMAEAEKLGENMKDNVKKGIDMMHAIEEEVYEQRLKLLRTRDNLAEAQSFANRGKELVNYFSNSMAKDKYMRILIIIMAILLVGCIVGLFMFKNQMKIYEEKKKEALLEEYGEIKEQNIENEHKVKSKDSKDTKETKDTMVLEKMEETQDQIDERLEKLRLVKLSERRRRKLSLTKNNSFNKNILGTSFGNELNKKIKLQNFGNKYNLKKFNLVKKNRRGQSLKKQNNNKENINLNNKIILDMDENSKPERNLSLDIKNKPLNKKKHHKKKNYDLDKDFFKIVDQYASKKSSHHRNNNMHIY